jgi:hypothetical protein
MDTNSASVDPSQQLFQLLKDDEVSVEQIDTFISNNKVEVSSVIDTQ